MSKLVYLTIITHQPLHHRWQLCLAVPHLRLGGDELVAQVALLAHAVVLRQGDWLAQRQYHIVLGQHAQRTADELTWRMVARPGWVEEIAIHRAAHLLERCHHCAHPSAHHCFVLTGKGIGAKDSERGDWWRGVHIYSIRYYSTGVYPVIFRIISHDFCLCCGPIFHKSYFTSCHIYATLGSMSMKRLVYGIAGAMIVFAGAGVIVAAQPKSGSSAPAYNATSATTGGHMAKALAPSDQPSAQTLAQRNQAIKIIIASNASPKAIKPASKPSETPTPTPAAEQKPAATNGASSGSNTRSNSNAQKSNPSNSKSNSNSNVPSPEFVDRVFATVNKERAARSLGTVQRIEQIDTSTRAQSAYNAQINKLSHDGGLDRLKQLYTCRTSGEILELVPISYNEQQATDVWINSPPHNKIMFSGDYDKAGIGLTRKGDQYYIAMQFCR